MRSFVMPLLIMVVVSCASPASRTPSPCPVTTAPPVALTPPPTTGTGPNSGLVFRAGPNDFLYANDALVVLLPKDGTWHPSTTIQEGLKTGWWRSAAGDLSISTRRLDGPATPLPADIPSGYGDRGFQVSGIRFPSAGCWEVSGSVAGKTLTFVVNVAER